MESLESTAYSLESAKSNTGASVEFRLEEREIPSKSAAEGRPIFESIEYVTIKYPGLRDFPDRPATEMDKMQYPVEYARFKQIQEGKGEVGEVGTSLTAWARITPARAKELRSVGFFSVEQIAAASDIQVKALGLDGFTLRAQAKTFLDESKGSAVSQKLAAENEKLKAQIESTNEVMVEMKRRLDELESKKSKSKKEKTE